MSKYADLFERIMGDNNAAAIFETLEWLDEHPDQVPGRTMTASEMDRKCNIFGNEYLTGFTGAGGRVVPDPVPTNAEKLAEILQVAMQEDGWGDEGEANILAAALEAAGVKAMGADDE